MATYSTISDDCNWGTSWTQSGNVREEQEVAITHDGGQEAHISYASIREGIDLRDTFSNASLDELEQLEPHLWSFMQDVEANL